MSNSAPESQSSQLWERYIHNLRLLAIKVRAHFISPHYVNYLIMFFAVIRNFPKSNSEDEVNV